MKTKKDLKEEYKQIKQKIGVFQIRNAVNGKIYVGSSVNLDAAWNRNRMQLNFGNHPNPGLQSEWKEFGADKFKYEILSEITQKEGETINYSKEAKELEAMYLEELQPFDESGYNVKAKA